MTIEIDQSGKLEQLNADTVLAYSDAKGEFTSTNLFTGATPGVRGAPTRR